MNKNTAPPRPIVYTARDLPDMPQLAALAPADRQAMQAVAAVLPFRVNSYVVDQLIDWSAVPADPIYQLTFPQPGMLAPAHLDAMVALLRRGAPAAEVDAQAHRIQRQLNPHPSGQQQMNVPVLDGASLTGMQHKYAETVLFFPAPGQTCHAYCTYCFRWAQFVGDEDLRFASSETETLVRYLRAHPRVTNVLITGGDPMVMRTSVLRRYLEPLLDLPQLESIRIGSKAVSYWPYRFTSDSDADDLMWLFETVVASGKSLAFMAHFSHPRELETKAARDAIARIRGTGAVIRAQAPLIRHVNDDAGSWAQMWREQTRQGIVPYYMFVERDTGASCYFEVPLVRALRIFDEAYAQVSGLARTVRGPCMSASPGKVLIDGVVEVGGQSCFVLKFLQARDPSWVGQPFFAAFDPSATWLDDLRPAFGEDRFFYQAGFERMYGAVPGDDTLDAALGG